MKPPVLSLLMFLLSCTTILAQSPAGVWRTIDDKTGEAKMHVEIFESEGQFYGRIVKLLHEPKVEACFACSDERKDQPLLGLVVIEHVKPRRNSWKGGEVLDPASGRTFNFSMWFKQGNPNRLKVRGKHWSGLSRTQIWERVK